MEQIKIRVKKYNVAHNELFLKGKNGLYCLLPFEKLDSNKKAIFKVGMTSQDVASRLENYHTYYPLGLYLCFFLSYPRLKKDQDRMKLYKEMEKKLITYLKESDAKMMVFPSRPSKRSEWFYTNYDDLQNSFRQVQSEYGGVLHEFSLDGINKQYDTIMKNKKKYVGEIVFKV
jgi:T5orf172 domain